MKNIHLIPTPNLSRLVIDTIENKLYYQSILHNKTVNVLTQNIYITNDEEIKEGDCCLDKFNQIWKLENNKLIAFDGKGIKRFSTDNISGHDCKKIILTTDQDLIKDGVQPINDEFLEWFVNNSSCEEVEIVDGYQMFSNKNAVKIYKIILPKEKPKQDFPKFGTKEFNDLCYKFMGGKSKPETLEEVDENKKNLYYYKQVMNPYPLEDYSYTAYEKGFIEGYQKSTNYQQKQDKNKYSEEDVREAFKQGQDNMEYSEMYGFDSKLTEQEWFEQFKKK